MYRQIIGYIPSNILPAFVAVAMVYVYTRLLSPAAFGGYSYVLSAVLVLQTSLFYALPIAVMRFFPAAARDGRQGGLLKEAYIVFYVMCLVLSAFGVCAAVLVPLSEEYKWAAWLAGPTLLFRSLVQLNQAVNRSDNLMGRYNTIESVHAVLGFGLGLGALYAFGRGAEAIVFGLLAAAVVCSLIDFRLLVSPFRRTAGALNTTQLIRLLEYGWPLVAVAATSVILQNSDRFLIGSLSGAGVLGVYAVAYSLVERPTTLICNLISTTTFPLVVQVLENEGLEAARLQAGRNGIALLALSLPTCVGLALTSEYIAATLVGTEFRVGVAALIPIMSFTALARGLRSHFIDHAFHLCGKPLLMLWTYGPVTVLNIALNLYFVPKYGITGAAWVGLFCQASTVVSGWFIGKLLFPIWLPLRQVIACILAVIPMTLALICVQFPMNASGLLMAVALGGALYVGSAIILNVAGLRGMLSSRLQSRLRPRMPALMD